MESLLGIRNINQIRTKADLVKYAVEFTANPGTCCQNATPNYEMAQGLIDFFNKNVTLPDTEACTLTELVEGMKGAVKVIAKEVRNCSNEEQE